ncbi:MAG: RNA polymerase sigma factor [Planctomycetota bacterium]|jgi:RNA polymerase sigma-70 factor (ECF subfamily)|nr:RNA polymerase sigma factor [Planctomycetota bacterium]MDP7251705.1 RNA polymerase sigma factor [Planctomycetota bacterium]
MPEDLPDLAAKTKAAGPEDLTELTDQQLMVRIRAEDECFRELVGRYERSVFLMAYGMLGARHDAEEVAQEAFLAIYKNAHLFKPHLPFSSWFYTIASNLCKNVLRSRKRKTLSINVEGAPEPKADDDINPLKVLQDRSTRDLLKEALNSLAPKYSIVLMLRYGEGCSYEEIGEQLGLTLSAVDTRLYRAKKQLKVILKRYGIENYPF